MDVDPYRPTPPSFTVLRIKRKATEPALSSLGMFMVYAEYIFVLKLVTISHSR